jgi:iron complex outermembrane receptor protein
MWPFDRRPRAAHHHEPRPAARARRAAPLVASALALALGLHAGAAHADARTEARRHFKAGMALVAQKKLVEGIKELEKAYEIYPHPNVAYNVAAAQQELGNYELAVAAYRSYLDSNPPDRAQVEKIITELQEKIAAQKAGAEVPPAPAAGEVKPGEAKPGEAKPGEAKPGEAKPGEAAAPEVKPGEPKPPQPAIIAEQPGVKPGGAAAGAAARTEDVYEEKVVTASRGAQSPLDSPNSTTIITKQDIRLSGLTRIPELLRRVAGMDVMEITGGDTSVSMRGFNSRQGNKLLVLVNGRSVYNDILGSTFWESLTIDVDQIERIEVVRGPGSALYGADAFAGVVNIITIAPGEGKPGFHFGIGDGGQGYGSAWAAGREGDFAYRASVGYTRYPRWTREIADGRLDVHTIDFDQNLAAENLRADLRGSYRLNKDNELTFGGGFSRIALDVYGIGPFNDYTLKGDTMDVGVDYKGKYVNAKAYFSRLDFTTGTDYQYNGHTLNEANPQQNVFNVEAEYVNDFRLPQALHHDIHIGLGYRLKDITWSYLEQPTPVEHHGSAYLQDTIKIGDKVNLVASGRVDYVPYLKRIVGSPRGSIVIKPTDRQAIRLSGSTAFRTPSFLEAYLHLPVQLVLPGVQIISATKELNDPTFVLQPEQVTTVEASYLNQQSDYFEFELTAYYNRVTSLIELAPVNQETLSDKLAGQGGYDPVTGKYTAAFGGWDNSPEIYNVFGGELSARAYPVEGLDIYANYAINYNVQQDIPAGALPDERTSHHKVNAGIQFRTKVGLNGEVSFSWQSSQVWREQVATLSGIVYENFPLPAYALFGGRLGFRFYKDRAEFSATASLPLVCDPTCGESPQEHPFGNRVGRRFMGFFSYSL